VMQSRSAASLCAKVHMLAGEEIIGKHAT